MHPQANLLAHQNLLRVNDAEALELFENAIATEPDFPASYWHLGIVQLIQGDELAARSTWLLALAKFASNEKLQEFQAAILASFDYVLVQPILPRAIALVLPILKDTENFAHKVLLAAVRLAYTNGQHEFAIATIEQCIRSTQNPFNFLRELAPLYQKIGNYDRAIQTARACCAIAENLLDRILANHLLIRSLMGGGGYWQEAMTMFKQMELLLAELIAADFINLTRANLLRLSVVSYFAPYLRDAPQQNRQFHNQIAQLCETNLRTLHRDRVKTYDLDRLNRKQISLKTRKLKIGYLSHCLNQHSVGWLARSLFLHHDRDRFQIHAYFVAYKQTKDVLQNWYVEQVDKAYRDGVDGAQSSLEIADRIHQDGIDILIDLDSLTLDINCETLALKPAPVQVSWLGWDASGFPAIDYYIADPYCLPEKAQNYYREKIWCLPQTFIAVDGFEVDVPTLRREHLGIPGDAVIYLSAQGGYKRHPDTICLQMQILKAVPNSYFLIKGMADQGAIAMIFNEIAQAEGVSCDRLRFLPMQSTEAIHRANLGIADIVLDTYPYNGATTTLETLWMGIPIITKVGEQFSARNSYSMMMNAGISEGIAWTDAEYIDWGTRLGTDSQLREDVAWKLRQSRHASSLWDGKSFAKTMGNAYAQMWEKYLSDRN
jgi:predicted O-linked N-acetylglucosamine transferase (SPINDLY family)